MEYGERLLAIRPFVPDTPLPANWKELLGTWLHGQDVAGIGQEGMRVVVDAFVYCLVWAIEAVRMNRQINGGESEMLVEGAAAACLEARLPSNAMAMLVRAGLSSRVAAKTVIEEMTPGFTNRTVMKDWLRSAEVVAFLVGPLSKCIQSDSSSDVAFFRARMGNGHHRNGRCNGPLTQLLLCGWKLNHNVFKYLLLRLTLRSLRRSNKSFRQNHRVC